MSDKMAVALTDNGGFRIYAAVTTQLVKTAQDIHGCLPVAAAALGRALTAASMMGAMLKDEGATVTVQFSGDGPLGKLLTVGNSSGNVKGWIQNPEVILPLNSKGKLDVGGGIGKGFLSVVRDAGAGTHPYTGQVELVSGEIAEDITSYYATSEQIPTAMALGVQTGKGGTVTAAGGYVVQMMPGHDPDDERIITQLEGTIAKLPPISELVYSGSTPSDIIGCLMGDIKYAVLSELVPQYKCDCSRERVERALISIGKKDLQSMLDDGKQTEIGCSFCSSKYNFSKDELKNLLCRCTH